MTKRVEKQIERLATLCTQVQHEDDKYVFIAHALWKILEKDFASTESDIQELERIINKKD